MDAAVPALRDHRAVARRCWRSLSREPWPGRRGIVLGLLLGVLQLGVGVGLLEGFERAPVALVTLLYFAYPLITRSARRCI